MTREEFKEMVPDEPVIVNLTLELKESDIDELLQYNHDNRGGLSKLTNIVSDIIEELEANDLIPPNLL